MLDFEAGMLDPSLADPNPSADETGPPGIPPIQAEPLDWELAEALPLALVVTNDECDRILYANSLARDLWKSGAVSAVHRLARRMAQAVVHPEQVTELWEQRTSLPDRQALVTSELALRSGRTLVWRSRRLGGAGRPPAVLHTFEERAGSAEVPEPPASEGRLFRLTFEKAAMGMTLVAPDLRFLRANPSFCQMVGYEEPELRQLSIGQVLYPEGGGADGEWEVARASGRETFHLDRRLIRRDGAVLWVHFSVSVVRDSAGRPVYYVAMAEDVTGRKHEEEERERQRRELETLASTDPLTGLFNHRYMQEYLGIRLAEAQRAGQPLSVLMLDVDHFRALNENFGHDVGDRALRAVADCMRHALRGQDVACRYGGEEFVIILCGTPFSAALAAAERVRRRVEAARPVAAGVTPVTCSIGVATYPNHASTAASLLKAADIALFEAKRSGRNRIAGYQQVPFECPPDHLEHLASTMHDASAEAVNALLIAIDLRDRFTGAHGQRVARVALGLARTLGCSEEDLETLRLAAPILDVGKIGLPDRILTKPGRLSREEWERMRQHPIWGEAIVLRSALPPAAAQVVRWHHERLDGSGYPDGLEGDQIPTLARIVAVADVATALRYDRPHRRAWPVPRVLDHLRRQAGVTLDPAVVELYCSLYAHQPDV